LPDPRFRSKDLEFSAVATQDINEQL